MKQYFLFSIKQELLIFKCVPLDNTGNGSNSIDFQLMWRRSFASPLFAIEYLDLTNDGLKELAVASLSGLHVLQVSYLRLVFSYVEVVISQGAERYDREKLANGTGIRSRILMPPMTPSLIIW